MPKVVYVRWVDSCGRDGWRERYEAKELRAAMAIQQVGFLVNEDDSQIVLSPTWLSESEGNVSPFLGLIAIPRVAVLEIREISLGG